MRNDYTQRFSLEPDDSHEKLRRDAMRLIESHGKRPFSDLPDMTEGERTKWFFWNLHENLDEFRKLEPTLVGQIVCTQLTVTEGLSMATEKMGSAQQIALTCRWSLRLAFPGLQNEEVYPMGEGSVDLAISGAVPSNPPLQKNQKGYIESDSSLYPNTMFVYGWVTEPVWNAVKDHLYSPAPTCHTDLILRDEALFPVKPGFGFVTGPAGAVGVTALEFRVNSHSADRRGSRRSDRGA
ncbi:hypothetical protein E4K72_19700 [Oxalobacteraceae bacterium OM1]|nr:hypothetical protein E4K72_19700 [Oxalobacteraceae bacterium OM1]